MILGKHGLGLVALGATAPPASTLLLAEFPTVYFSLQEHGTLATAAAPLPSVEFALSPQATFAAGMSALPVSEFVLSAVGTTASAQAVLPVSTFTLNEQVMGASATVPMPTATFWLIPYIGAEAVEVDSAVLAINASTLAVTEYSVAAIDVLEHDGEVWFVTADGLSKLAAGAGVAGTITTGDLELAGPGSVSLNLARLGLKADGELHITATAHQDGGQRSTRYLVPKRTGANDRDRNVKLGNGVLGNAWSFTIASPTGQVCNWSLSEWQIEPGQYKLRRR